jgi:hypothetical protein
MDELKRQLEAGSLQAAIEAVKRRSGLCATGQGGIVALVINRAALYDCDGECAVRIDLPQSDAHHLLFQLMWILGGTTLHERITAALECLRDTHEPGESYGMALAAVDRAFGRAGEPIPSREPPKEPSK